MCIFIRLASLGGGPQAHVHIYKASQPRRRASGYVHIYKASQPRRQASGSRAYL